MKAYKTHVYVDGKRKAIERSSMDAMVNVLCDFYRRKANEKTTLREGLELLLKRKLDKGRQISTVKNNRLTQ